jgi:hypothetical protein
MLSDSIRAGPPFTIVAFPCNFPSRWCLCLFQDPAQLRSDNYIRILRNRRHRPSSLELASFVVPRIKMPTKPAEPQADAPAK